MPGPPSGNETYVISISIPGPLTREQITAVNKKIRECLKDLNPNAVCSEQKVVPKKC